MSQPDSHNSAPVEISRLIQSAIQNHQAGRLPQAQAMYQQILALQPDHAEVLHLLGILSHQSGQNDRAAELITKALSFDPNNAGFWNNLGLVLRAANRSDGAASAFRKAIAINPRQADAHINLGILLRSEGKLDEAIASVQHGLELNPTSAEGFTNLGNLQLENRSFADAITSYRRAIAIAPKLAEAHSNLGNVLSHTGQHPEAVAAYEHAILLNPQLADAHKNLGAVLKTLGRVDEAIKSCFRAIQLQPTAAAYYNLGACLQEKGARTEAIECYRKAVEMLPTYAEAYNNLGQLLRESGRTDEALSHCRRALELKPDLFEVYGSLSLIMQDKRQLDEAVRYFDRALQLRPDDAQTRFNRAMLLLLKGDFQQGWREYEWRWQAIALPTRRQFTEPLWDGSDLNGAVILLYAEQGVGDAIQFARYVPMVTERGGKVILDCHPSLRSLFQSVKGVHGMIVPGAILPEFTVQCPLLSLPLAFKTTLETIPGQMPYLMPDPARLDFWRQRLQNDDNRKVGLCFAGNPRYLNDRARSIDAKLLAKLAGISGVSFYSLQKGTTASQPIPNLDLIDYTGELHDWADTAALVMNLDLVISVDTAVAHLAGALGRPCWTMLPFTPDWRWMLDQNDTPWYPSMRLFRQTSPGDWTSVIENVFSHLSQEAGRPYDHR